MMNGPRRHAFLISAAVAIGAVGCERNTPADEMQTMTVQPRMESVSTSGCLRGGMAENTFVLTTGGMEPMQPESEATTYHLMGHAVDLREFVGQRVEVTGTLRSASEIASKGAPIEEKTEGTSGTPTIETKTELSVKELTVESVKATGDRCAEVRE
jgi:hypothetical protein